MYQVFLPTEKEEKNYMARAFLWAFILVGVLFTVVGLAGAGVIKINMPENVVFILFGICCVAVGIIPCILAVKGALQMQSKRTAFLYYGEDIYMFTTYLTTGNYAQFGNIVAGSLGAAAGLSITYNEQKKYEMMATNKEYIFKLYEKGWLEKIEEIYDIKENEDSVKLNCFITGKTPTTAGTIVNTDRKGSIYIRNVYENYEEFKELLKSKLK